MGTFNICADTHSARLGNVGLRRMVLEQLRGWYVVELTTAKFGELLVKFRYPYGIALFCLC
jgi:hypothetical protein